MNKFAKFAICFVIAFSFFVMGISMSQKAMAYAETDSGAPNITTGMTTSHKGTYIDSFLFEILYRYDEYLRDTENTTNSIALDAFSTCEVIDISTDVLSTYGINSVSKITSLSGLEYFQLGSLKTLKVNGHAITDISSLELNNAPNLTTLEVKNNNISSVDLSESNRINYIDLSSNNLTEIDLSFLVKNDTDGNPTAILSNNYISEVNKIVLPTSANAPVNLYLTNNQLIDATENDFPVKDIEGKVIEGQKHNVSLLVQGHIKDMVDNQYITVTPDIEYQTFNVRLYDTSDTPTLLARAGYGSDTNQLVFTAGNNVIRYYLSDEEISSTTLIKEDYKKLFVAQDVKISPIAPKMIVVYNNEEIEYTGAIKDEFDVYATTNYDGAKVYMRVNGGEWQEATHFSVQERGSYKIEAYLEYNGIASEVSRIDVSCSINTAIIWGFIIIACGIGLGFAIYIIIKWYQNGASVAPIEPKNNKKKY